MRSRWRARRDITRSFLTDRAKPKIHSSPISPLPPEPARSRRARLHALTGLQNTTSFCASKKSLARQHASPAVRYSPPDFGGRAEFFFSGSNVEDVVRLRT